MRSIPAIRRRVAAEWEHCASCNEEIIGMLKERIEKGQKRYCFAQRDFL